MTNKVLKKRPIKKPRHVKPAKPLGKLGRMFRSIGMVFGKFKWVFIELVKVYSNETSYFSKKRLESGVGFVIAEWGMIFWLVNKWATMDTYDFAIWASMQFLVAGYMVKQIQREKELDSYSEEPSDSEYNDDCDEPENYDGDDESYDSGDCNDENYDSGNNCNNCESNSNDDDNCDDNCDDNENNDKHHHTRKSNRGRN